jgi:hypothetical protein
MAERTPKPGRAPVNLTPPTRELLNGRLAELRATEGRYATQDQLIAALLEGVPLWQADLMLRTYIKQHPDSPRTDPTQATG